MAGVVNGIRYKGVFGTISTIIKTEGPKSLYNGLVAGLQRQMSFASIRIGLYDTVKLFYTNGKESKSMTITKSHILYAYYSCSCQYNSPL